MRALITCDSGDVVAGIVDFVVSQHTSLRILSRALARAEAAPLALAIIVMNALRCYAGVYPDGRGSVVFVARRPNERRAVGPLKDMMPEHKWTEFVVGWRFVHVARALARLSRTIVRDCRRTIRLARMLSRRFGVFRALRVVELLAYYRRYCELLAGRPFELAVMSSHSNPHGIALNLASARLGVPIVLITHGMPVLPIARLDYDLAIMECEASRRVYEAAGCRMEQVVVKSRTRDWSPMRVPVPSGQLRIGVFLSKDPVEERVVRCLRRLLTDPRVVAVLVRPHPVNLWPGLTGWIASLGDDRVRLHSTRSLDADVRDCDVVLAGNSTVLLDALVAGCPACYVRGFDHGPFDVQGFVRDGLVCELPELPAIDYDAVGAFYRRDGWPQILRHYADIDRDDLDVGRSVRTAMKRIVTGARHERIVA